MPIIKRSLAAAAFRLSLALQFVAQQGLNLQQFAPFCKILIPDSLKLFLNHLLSNKQHIQSARGAGDLFATGDSILQHTGSIAVVQKSTPCSPSNRGLL